MHERVESGESQDAGAPPAAVAVRQSPSVAQILALQRSAGNAAVTRLIQREDDVSGRGLKWDPSLLPEESYVPTGPIRPFNFVFILGAKDDAALANAIKYYKFWSDPLHTRVLTRDDIEPTIAGIFNYLSQISYPIYEITLVIHGSGDGTLSAPLNSADTDTKTSPEELEAALRAGVLAPLRDGQITPRTRIRLQACFAGFKATMVNLLDRAFGDGAGTVVAPTVEVGYSKGVMASEGITGWWVWSDEKLTAEELAVALKAKYAASLKGLDLTTFQEGERAGQTMTEAEMWLEISKEAVKKPLPETDKEGVTQYLYVANAFVQSVKLGYEDDPALYTKSVYYSPDEI